VLYHLFSWLDKTYDIPGFGVFNYLTFRAALIVIFSLLISLVFGKRIINILRKNLIGEQIRNAGPESHQSKKGTPTMGGIIIIGAIVAPLLLWGDLTNAYLLLLILATLWMGVIGFIDDYIKVFKKNKAGLKAKFKIFGQVVLGTMVGTVMVLHPDFHGEKRRLQVDGVVKVNDYLKKIGFKAGDKLVKIEESADLNKTIQPYKSYTVLRDSVSKLVRIHISKSDRIPVARQLFGMPDAAFVTYTNVPFLKDINFDYGNFAFWAKDKRGWAKFIYVLVVIFIVTAVSNGVNITDGLDGLAAGTVGIVGFVLGAIAYVSSNFNFSKYLNISFIPFGSEIFIFAIALTGACIGFLWYNAYPAQVFMGDTGSLALGGAVGVMALMVKKELLLPILCGVFFIESLSVMIQVSYFKYTKRKYGVGKRIFKMSPLHHHFELCGWHEAKIVTRFWIATALLGILTLVTLKLR
jgi:phospho-N-acetylmuramoyl-pentapeptide-transferase